MFTGIIHEVGIINNITKSSNENKIHILCNKVLNNNEIGDSIAVNGVCLTIITLNKDSFVADVSDETWLRSNLSALKKGDLVNLESALSVGSKIGGHFVQGHVDCKGIVVKLQKQHNFYNCFFTAPENFSQFMVEKGSIAINGISLTIASLENNKFSCAVIPHTWENTNMKLLKQNSSVNIEIDILAKYVLRALEKGNLTNSELNTRNKSNIDKSFLAEHGYF